MPYRPRRQRIQNRPLQRTFFETVTRCTPSAGAVGHRAQSYRHSMAELLHCGRSR
ncbi:hypothetical protein OE88DRAFT_1727742 [Heliocybe sulcata]|uniref:Uncharacterized protein n=1 Tax=Heliocybe sulcata TaxID=5364 RepID=A0A5C3MUG3_9AGAM|nr:hypothetical protein OE88DRAFT_1727742 [Heliocybe sulcata]